MTTAEAAAALGIHRSRVLHLINEGRLHAERHGRDWWISPDEVERFKHEGRKPEGWQKGRKRKKDKKDAGGQ